MDFAPQSLCKNLLQPVRAKPLINSLTVFEIIKSEVSINKKKRIPLILFKLYK